MKGQMTTLIYQLKVKEEFGRAYLPCLMYTSTTNDQRF